MSEIDYQALRERYSPKPVPECSVCGEEMSIQRISGAHVVYACSGEGDDGYFKIGRTFADEHYEESRVTVVDDSDRCDCTTGRTGGSKIKTQRAA